jgi:hypothetical protein
MTIRLIAQRSAIGNGLRFERPAHWFGAELPGRIRPIRGPLHIDDDCETVVKPLKGVTAVGKMVFRITIWSNSEIDWRSLPQIESSGPPIPDPERFQAEGPGDHCDESEAPISQKVYQKGGWVGSRQAKETRSRTLKR